MSRIRRLTSLAGPLLIAAVTCLARAQLPQAPLLHVVLTGFHSDRGQAQCALFSSAADFPKRSENAIAHVHAAISNQQAVCDFSGIAPGTYAVAVFHDENANGKLDTNLLGIPREGVGASNNAAAHFGPPKFAEASFHFTGDALQLNITIHYL